MLSQEQILNKVLLNKDLSIITMNDLDESYFFNYKTEYNYLRNHYDTYRCIPDPQTFHGVFPDFKIYAVNEPDNFLLEKLYEDYNRSYLAVRFNTMKGFLESGNTEGAMQYFTDSLEGLKRGSAMTCTDITKDMSRFDRYVERCANKYKYFASTGFPELDEHLGGIDLQNELLVISARPGVGKTQIGLKMLASAAKQGLVSGGYEGEMTTDKVGYRVDTFLGGVSNSALNKGRDLGTKYRSFMDSYACSDIAPIKVLTLLDVPGKGVTVDTLRAFIEKEHLQFLLVDQVSLMEDQRHGKSMFERAGNIVRDLKQLQVEKQIPIVVIAQMNRTKNDDGKQDTNQIGLSDLIPQYATTLLMLDKKDTEKPDGSVERHLSVFVAKARDGGDGKTFDYIVDWDKGRFTLFNGQSDEQGEEMANRYLTEDGVQF